MTANLRTHPVIRLMAAIVLALTTGLAASTGLAYADTSPPRNTDVLGAFSQVSYQTLETDYEFDVFLSDTIRDQHRCAYVELALWYRGDASLNLWSGGINSKRVTVCDDSKFERVSINTNEMLDHFWRRMIAGTTKIEVKTCEDMGWREDRCSAWFTKPLDN